MQRRLAAAILSCHIFGAVEKLHDPVGQVVRGYSIREPDRKVNLAWGVAQLLRLHCCLVEAEAAAPMLPLKALEKLNRHANDQGRVLMRQAKLKGFDTVWPKEA